LFKGDSDYLVMDAIVNGKVPLPRVRRPDLPNELSSIIMKALAVDPNRRFQSADEMRQALDQYAENAGLAVSTSTLASYMKKLFGDKPEPWIDTARFELVADRRSSRNSWSDIPRSSGDLVASADQATRSLSRSTSPPSASLSGSHRSLSNSGSHSSIGTPSSPAIGRTTTGNRAIRETRTSTRMAWENQGEAPPAEPPPMRGLTKVLLIAAPVALAIGGIGAWQYMEKQHGAATAVAPAAMVAHTTPTITPLAPDPVPEPAAAPPPVVEPDANVAPSVAAAPVAKAPVVRTTPRAVPARAPARGKAAVVLNDDPAPALEATPVPKPEPVAPLPTPTPTPTPPAPPPPPPAPAVVAEPTMMVLSSTTVSLVAGDHAGQLAKCEGSGSLHGDIAISFEINGAGRVTKSQVSSTIKNIKVVSCILTAVRSWQFPKPPSGAAKGVYTITYQ
jgi:hypothetical protein